MNDWLLWQLADSAFPTGGFVHSGGLEAAAQFGLVAAIGLEVFLAQALTGIASNALPFVAATHADAGAVATLDRRCDATLTNHVANRASRAQGQALVATSAAAFPALAPVKATLRAQATPGHLAPWTGAVAAALGLDAVVARRLFLFTQLRGLVSSAIRLGLTGPLAAQALQARLAPTLEPLAARTPRPVADAAGAMPLADLVHAQHDRLYSRLFNT